MVDLTPSMKRAIFALSAEFYPVPRTSSSQALLALYKVHPDLVEREWQDGCAQCFYYRLTDEGLAVRSALLVGER